MKKATRWILVLVTGFTALPKGVSSPADDQSWVSISSALPVPAKIAVVESSPDRTVLDLEVAGFTRAPLSIGGKRYTVITVPGASQFLRRGLPGLPRLTSTLAVPGRGKVTATVTEARFQEFHVGPIAPAKGDFPRTVDPDAIPYEFDDFYRSAGWFPSENVRVGNPFIFRDIRGVTVQLYPFQYNPAREVLRVASRLRVTVEIDPVPGRNEKSRPLADRVTAEFYSLYRNLFDNFSSFEVNNGGPWIQEPGKVVMITHDDFLEEAVPLAEWKVRKGLSSQVLTLGDVGFTSSEIKQTLKTIYDQGDLSYVVLIGDAEQIPVLYGSTGVASDPSYVMLEGDDSYPDAIISRISAARVWQVRNQVTKFLSYERNPGEGEWYHWATGVASNEGSDVPPDSLSDRERADMLRNVLLDHGFTRVDQIYDPGASRPELRHALGEGRSVVYYLGHGSGTAWSTTGFDVSDASGLSNGFRLPFIVDVSSFNGQWYGKTCLAEAFLRNGNGGAAGMLSSSTTPTWVPPTVMQRAVIDLMVREPGHTMGGLALSGSVHTLETYGGNREGVAIVEQYNLFGDGTLPVRTSVPVRLRVNHDPVLPVGTRRTTVEVDRDRALVGLTLGGELYASALTDHRGVATLDFVKPLDREGELALAVTAPNAVPYEATVPVVEPSRSFVVVDSFEVDDQAGNGDGTIDSGEEVNLTIWATNRGKEFAYDVLAMVTSSDTYVTVLDGNLVLGDLPPGGWAESLYPVSFIVSSRTPDGHDALFGTRMIGRDARGKPWVREGQFSMPVEAPVLTVAGYTVEDAGTNGVLDPGETGRLRIILKNEGGQAAVHPEVVLRDLSGFIRIHDNRATFPPVDSGGGTAVNDSDPLIISAAQETPVGSEVSMAVEISAESRYRTLDRFDLVVGENEFSSGDVPLPFGSSDTGSVLSVPISVSVADVDVFIEIAHPASEEIEIVLESPSGTEIILASRVGSGPDSFLGTVFDDDAAALIVEALPPFYGPYRPEEPLSKVSGEDAYGDWILHVMDTQPSQNDGVLMSWGLTLKEGEPLCSRGDVNGDGITDVDDVNLAARLLLGMVSHPTAWQLCAADFDGDGEITIFDLVKMMTHIYPDRDGSKVPVSRAAVREEGGALVLDSDGNLGAIQITMMTEGKLRIRPSLKMHSVVASEGGKTGVVILARPGEGIPPGTIFETEDRFAIDEVRASTLSGEEVDVELLSGPPAYVFHGNAPNPFNSSTVIRFDLKDEVGVRLEVYDTMGREIATLAHGRLTAGRYALRWNGRDGSGRSVSSGVYILRLTAGTSVVARKVILLR